MICNGTGIVTAKTLIIFVFILINVNQGNTWYIGCVEDNPSLVVPQDPLHGPVDGSSLHDPADGDPNSVDGTTLSPASCCSYCLQARYEYAAIRAESVCKCSNTTAVPIVLAQHCNQICDTGVNQLPCGGTNTLSMYGVRGPYLVDLQLEKTQSLVQQEASVMFEAKTYLAQELQENDDVPNLSDTGSLEEVDFVWFVGQSQWNVISRPSSNDTIQATLVHTFLEEGEWTIGVQVRNPVSTLSASTNVTVVRPTPSDLQVNLHPSQDDIPSCVPIHDVLSSHAAASVFVEEEIIFQASLGMGINLTFQWSFSDDGASELRAPYAMQPLCEGIACLQDSQVHTFMSEGVYSVSVNASNSLGSVHKVLHVIVMNRDVANLNMSLDSQLFLHTLNSNINLLITMETAARSELILEIDFGDGSKYNHSLKDSNDTFILGGEQNVAHLHLTASYGDGCQLFVSLDHVYGTEGLFYPIVSVYSEMSNITASAKLAQPVLIQRTLEGVFIDGDEVYSTNQSAILRIIMPAFTQNVTCSWTIIKSNETVHTSADCEFTYTFTRTGIYLLSVSVQNLVSEVKTERTVHVQDPVVGLQVEGHIDGVIQTGSDVSIIAYISQGSEVNLIWDFGDGITSFTEVTKLESDTYAALYQANHTYVTSGHFTVSVTAENRISSLHVFLPHGFIVQEPIQDLSLPPMLSTMLHATTEIQTSLGRGSDVNFYLDYGDGLISPNVMNIHSGLYRLRYIFPESGVYDVTVVAENGVSSQNASLCVVVQDVIGLVSVSSYHLQTGMVILVANIDGEPVNRTDLKYTWHISGSTHVSASPLFIVEDITLPVLQVSLNVANQVGAQDKTGDVVLVESAMEVVHPIYAEVNQQVTFTVKFPSEQAWNVTIRYSNIIAIPHVASVNSSTYNWTHTFTTTGVQLVTVTMESDGEEIMASSALSIQEHISSVNVSGPALSKFTRLITSVVYEAISSSGSDILYSWSVTNVATGLTQNFVGTSVENNGYRSKMPLSFPTPGDYNITVVASNALSSFTTSMLTNLQEAILNINILMAPVAIGHPSTLEITIEGGSSLQLDIDFGDGRSLHIPSLEEAVSRLEIIETRYTPLVAMYSLTKVYERLGEYHVTVQASNAVSELAASAITQVEEGIVGLQLSTEGPNVLRTSEEVVFLATVESGNGVLFHWDFGGYGTQVESFHNKSIARHRFYYPGNFNVHVFVSNHLQQDPLSATHPDIMVVQAPIIPATLDVQVDIIGAPLYMFPMGSYGTEEVMFRASCEGSHVEFEFDYGDGVVEVVTGVSELAFTHGFGRHSFNQVGNYTITVRARNFFSNASKTLASPFYVQFAPVLSCPLNPCFCNNPLSNKKGEVTNFTVTLDRGTNVFYNWSMGDQTDYFFHGNSVRHQYLSTSSRFGYIVTVVGFNLVGNTGPRQCRVFVEEEIQHVELLVAESLHPIRTAIDFQAVGALGAREYVWDMGDGHDTRQSHEPIHSYQYNYPGTYGVTVTAKNFVSSITSEPVELIIQEPIKSLSIILVGTREPVSKSCCSALIGQHIDMQLGMLGGSHLKTVWNFGDGSELVLTDEHDVSHSYNRTGQFRITAFASNALGNDSASTHLFVLNNTICYPPPITVVGGTDRKANFAADIRIEIAIGIMCDITNVVIYAWTLTDANGAAMTVDSAHASLNQRTAFIKRRTLQYGTYTLSLKAAMNGTLVYSEASLSLTITPTPLVAFIDGGTTRYVGNDSDVIVDASKSYDLDHPESTNLIYKWSCYQLISPSTPCFPSFSGSDPTQSNSSSLVFHTSDLLLNETTAFVFAMDVSKEGHQTVKTSQVLYVKHYNPLKVLIECTSCEDGMVNRNDMLTLNAVCNECSPNTTYKWTIYSVNDGVLPMSYNYPCQLTPKLPPGGLPQLPSISTPPPATNMSNNSQGSEKVRLGSVGSTKYRLEPNPQPSPGEDYDAMVTDPNQSDPLFSFNEEGGDEPGDDTPSLVEDGGDEPSLVEDGGGQPSFVEDGGDQPSFVEDGGDEPGDDTPSLVEDGGDTPSLVEDGTLGGGDVQSYEEYHEYVEEDLGDVSIGEVGDYVSIHEEVPGGADVNPDSAAGQDSINITMEEVEATTIIYETTQELEIVDEQGNNEPSLIEEGAYNPSIYEGPSIYEEPNPQESFVEYEEPAEHPDSFVEQYSIGEDTGGTESTGKDHGVPGDSDASSNGTMHRSNPPGGESEGELTTDKPEYVDEEYTEYEYVEGTDDSPPTASYNTGGVDSGSIQEGGPPSDTSIPEFGTYDDSYDYEVPVEDIGSDNPPNNPDSGESGEGSVPDSPGGGGDNVVDPDAPTPGSHLVEQSLNELSSRALDTSGKSLTIMNNFLDEGLTYAVEVEVNEPEGAEDGKASQYFYVNVAPHYGHCFLMPNQGNELDQVFQVNCHEWIDDDITPLWMELSFRLNESDSKTVLYYGINQELKFQLPAGYGQNNTVWVNIDIIDSNGGRASVCSEKLTVTPRMFAPGESKEEFLYSATVPMDSRLKEYIHTGDHTNVGIDVTTTANVLNRLDRLAEEDLSHTLSHMWHDELEEYRHMMAKGSNEFLLDLRRAVRKALLAGCGYLPMRDSSEIMQRVFAMSISSAVPEELSIEAITLASGILDSCTSAALHCSHEDNVEIPLPVIQAFGNTASNIIDALALNHTQSMDIDDRMRAVDRTISALSKVLKDKLSTQEKDNNQFILETPSLNIQGARVSSLSNKRFVNSYTSVILPSNMYEELLSQNPDAFAEETSDQCQGIEILSFLQNPFSWGRGGDRVTSAVASVELFSCDTYDKLNVGGLEPDNGVVMEFHHTCHHDHAARHCNFTFSTAFMSVHQFNVSMMNIRQTFHISLEMTNHGRTLPVGVLLRYQDEPTPYEYDFKWVYTPSDTKLDIFLPPDWFNVSGSYYLALLDDVFDQEVYRGDAAKERPYRLRMWWGDCLYWEPEDNEWLRSGCTALPSSTFEKTVCQCEHLSTFAVSFYPLITTARFVELAMFLRPNTNAIPYCFVSALIGVYVILFIYCYLADKHDERKQGLIYLKDNQASDQQYYEITVETGFRTGAGTTARVSIVLHGDDGHSETKELICDDGRPLFERNSRDRFIISVPESLGNIYKVLVWHNNGGISPGWYLSRVAVRDLMTGHKWYFICERWFAVEEDDGRIERSIDVLKEGVGFQKAFWAKGAQYFADYYIWSSVFTRPPYSVFTRVQRLTCCLSISMGFLSICALRYYLMNDEDLELGLVDVSGEAVAIGIVVALLAIPVNFPIIMLFRRAKVNYEPEKPEIFSGMRASEIYGDSSPEFDHEKIMRGESWDSGMMDQQTAITLQNLQAWAKQKWRLKNKQNSMFPPNKVTPIEMTAPGSESTDQYLSDQQSIFDFGSLSSFDISDSGLSSSYNHSLNGFHHVCVPRHKRVNNPKIWLPSSFLYIAWGICFGIIIFSAVITSVLGYRFNRTKAIYWTQSVYFSFLQCIFVTQPAVMAMFTIVKSWRHRNNIKIFDHYDDNIDLVDRKSLHRSRLDLYDNDFERSIAARQRSRYLRFARPPQDRELQKAKERMMKEKNMYTILKDAVLYTIVFVCLLWVAYGKDLKDHHPVNTAVVNTFVNTPQPFTNISTVSELWHWMENDMVDVLYWEKWYNGQNINNGIVDKGTLMDGAAVLIGRASIRQLRVKPDTCHIAPEVRHLFEECHGAFSLQSTSMQSYGPNHVWYYQGKNELHRANKWGMFGSYEGDGYAISLNNSRLDAARQVAELKANSWIDPQTRLVTIEFTLYNAPTNLFTSVSLLAEIPGTGGVYPFPKIESVLLYRYETAYDYFIICCEMLFLLLVAVTAKSEIHKAIRLRMKYFYSMWSWIEMGTIIIALTYFAMYVTRFIFVEEVIHRFHSTYLEEFVDVSAVAYWDQCLRDLIGSLLFLIGVKLLHLCRFNGTVAKFGAVLGGAIKEILLFAFYYILLELAFACFGVLLLGSHFYPMKHAFTALEALSSSTVGHTAGTEDVQIHHPFWWPMYCILHMVFSVLLLSAFIKAVLCHSYKEMKDFERDEVTAGELFKFFWDHFMAFFGILKLKDSNNMGKNTLPPEFTMAEIEYQVDELLFKMNAMSREHSLPEKWNGYSDDSDEHDYNDDTISYASSALHSIDQARVDERVQKIETNLYGANPELRELLDGVCLIDEDREKELRSQLEVEIFRQLQMQRQEEVQQQVEQTTNDSGRDTQSVSDKTTSEELARPRPLPSIRGEDGRISFPKPVPNLGLLDDQMSASSSSSNRMPPIRPAWNLEPRKSSTSSPDNISQDNLTNNAIDDRHVDNMGSALFVRRSPQLSQTEGSSSEPSRGRRLANHPRLKRRGHSARSRDSRPSSGQLVTDYPEGACYDNNISIEGFPLPNTLESLSSSSDEADKPTLRRKQKDAANLKRRLRKTRSQGKGKGRGRYGDDDEEENMAYLNAGYSSDESNESIPIIPMGFLKYNR